VHHQEERILQRKSAVPIINTRTPLPILSKKPGISIASMTRGERYVFSVGVNLCAPTGDKKFTARCADQRVAKVSASTDDRKAGVNNAKEKVFANIKETGTGASYACKRQHAIKINWLCCCWGGGEGGM
jgi:hypothetical protein